MVMSHPLSQRLHGLPRLKQAHKVHFKAPNTPLVIYTMPVTTKSSPSARITHNAVSIIHHCLNHNSAHCLGWHAAALGLPTASVAAAAATAAAAAII
jgi:hypothetical protein